MAHGNSLWKRRDEMDSASECKGGIPDAKHSSSMKQVDVLPLNTRVRVVGNRRTSQSLVGKEGVVIKTAPLGGWHKLKMDNGESVKVQRNGLYVMQWGNGEVPCDASDSDDFIQERQKNREREREVESPFPDPSTPPIAAQKRPRRPALTTVKVSGSGVNLQKMETDSLRRYLVKYGVPFSATAPRSTLLTLVGCHFEECYVDEWTVVTNLSKAWNRRKRQRCG